MLTCISPAVLAGASGEYSTPLSHDVRHLRSQVTNSQVGNKHSESELCTNTLEVDPSCPAQVRRYLLSYSLAAATRGQSREPLKGVDLARDVMVQAACKP